MTGIKELLRDEAGVEPMVMKLLAAVALLAVAIGIGVTIYSRAGGIAENKLENIGENI